MQKSCIMQFSNVVQRHNSATDLNREAISFIFSVLIEWNSSPLTEGNQGECWEKPLMTSSSLAPNTFLTAAGYVQLQQLHLVLIWVCMRTILTHTHTQTREAFPFEAVIGRHHPLAVDVCGALWKPDNWQELDDETSCYRESKSVRKVLQLHAHEHTLLKLSLSCLKFCIM